MVLKIPDWVHCSIRQKGAARLTRTQTDSGCSDAESAVVFRTLQGPHYNLRLGLATNRFS